MLRVTSAVMVNVPLSGVVTVPLLSTCVVVNAPAGMSSVTVSSTAMIIAPVLASLTVIVQ